MPLNPTLHQRLNRLAPGGVVAIANEGSRGSARKVRCPGGGTKLQIGDFGETYRVNCPFCNDTRGRLWINWRYGQPDPSTDDRLRIDYLARCFNEECVPDDRDNRNELAERLLGFRNRNQRGQAWITNRGRSPVPRIGPCAPPGQTIPLMDLPDGDPAVAYLLQRGFSRETARRHGLSCCVQADPRFTPAQGRIICPIDFNFQRVGWQARFVGTPPSRDIPKYYTMPGLPKRAILYNFDRAKDMPFVVVTEGVTDVWRVGDHGVALLGHDATSQQIELLQTLERKPIVVLLDGDEKERAQRLQRELPNQIVATIRLQEGVDPADMPRQDLHREIDSQMRDRGIELRWS